MTSTLISYITSDFQTQSDLKVGEMEWQKIMIERFFMLTGIKKTKVLFSLNHGWKYSSNSKPLRIKSYWNSTLNLGVCADWFVGPRLESGWISAIDLFKKINK